MVTYACRVALRVRPLRAVGAIGTLPPTGPVSTTGGTTPEGAAVAEVGGITIPVPGSITIGGIKRPRHAPIPDQRPRLHDARQHGHHQHPQDLYRVHLRLVSRPVLIVVKRISPIRIDFKLLWGEVMGAMDEERERGGA